MFSRRGFLTGMVAGGLARSLRLGISPENPHSITPVQFDVPERACDCHVHVFGDASRFPFAASRTYTPESSSAAELLAAHRALHISPVVVKEGSWAPVGVKRILPEIEAESMSPLA